MNESQTRLLIQRELDGNLSQEEETRLRRVLMVSDSAVSFRANLSQVVAAAKDLELPDDVRPGDSSQLAVEIIENLPVVKGNFWDPLFDIFAGRKSAKADPRSTRSVASPSIKHRASGVAAAGNAAAAGQGKGTGINTSGNHTAIGASGARSLIDPAIVSPKETVKEEEKGKTPNGLPAVDQYLTGTHSAVGGLAKKLRKDFGNTQQEDVGKTLADAIREKVHESYNSTHDSEQMHDLMDSQSQTHAYDAVQDEGQQDQTAVEHQFEFTAVDAPVPAAPPNLEPQHVLPAAIDSPHIVHANLSIQSMAPRINLGNSMVLTVATPSGSVPEPPHTSPNAQASGSKGHGFATEELEWKSGSYPAVPPPVKPWVEAQAETGPLAPFPMNVAPGIGKLNLKDTAEIMKQLAADSQKERPRDPWTAWVPPPTPENPAPPADPWAPSAVQVPVSPSHNSWVQHPVAPNQWAPPAPPAPEPFALIPFAPEPTAPEPVAPTTPIPIVSAPARAPIPVPMPLPLPLPTPAPKPVTPIPILSSPAPAPVPSPLPVQKPEPIAQPEPSIPQSSETATEAVGYAPTIVPVTRNSLPIEAIGERINQLFYEPTEAKPPTSVSQPVKDVQPAQLENAAMENDVKECLSSIGRLADLRYATNSPGHIKDLGRFLLTEDAIESIGDCISKGQGHSHARVVTLETAQQIATALEPVLNFKGVAGYMVCGYDGLPILSNLPAEVDMELLGGCALVTFMNSHSIMKVMGHTKVNQLICQTPGGCMLLSLFGKGFLVTLTNERDASMLASLTETIASVSSD